MHGMVFKKNIDAINHFEKKTSNAYFIVPQSLNQKSLPPSRQPKTKTWKGLFMHDARKIVTSSNWKLAALYLSCLSALAPAYIRAQLAPPPAPELASTPAPPLRMSSTQAPGANDDDVVQMSPFNVTSSGDSRYQAASTLAGSRLNTNLQDVAAVIDVFTADLIDDLGVTDLDRIQDYATNVEVDASSIGTFGNGGETGRGFRIRGLAGSRARNYFTFYLVADTYNIERVDESRGPNSILFGFGSPGGIVNVTTKRAQTSRNRASMTMMIADTTGRRFTLDANRVLLKNMLALRLNLLTQDKDGWMAYNKDDRNAVNAAVTFTPWKKSAFYLEYEHFEQQVSAARGNTYWTQTDTWDAAGKPLIHTSYANRANVAANPLLAGNADKIATLANAGSANTWVVTDQTGAIANWKGMSVSNRASFTDVNGQVWTAMGDFRDTMLNVPGILKVNLMGPSNTRDTKYNLCFVTFQQEILPKLNFEAAATWQYNKWSAVRYGNVTLYADPNYYLPDGGAGSTGPAAVNPVKNPFAGDYYVQGAPQFWRSSSQTRDLRATLSYDLNLGKNLGRHQFAFLVERDMYNILTAQFAELARIDGVVANTTTPSNAANSIYRRSYVLDPNNPMDFSMPSVHGIPIPLDVMTSDGHHLTSELATSQGTNPPDYRRTVDTFMGVLQSTWLSGRLNTIFGLRSDSATYYDWGTYMNNGDGAYVRNPASYTVTRYPSKTYTYSGVWRVANWLSVFFNASTSMGDPQYKVVYAPYASRMDSMTGIGQDYGVKFSIPGTQLYGIVTYYQAKSTNQPTTGGVTQIQSIVNQNNQLVGALQDAGIMTAAEAAPYLASGGGDTVDPTVKGVEAAIVGSITKNWSIRLTYAYTNLTETNVMPHLNGWLNNVLRPFWADLERVNPYDEQQRSIMDSVLYSGQPIRVKAQQVETNIHNDTVFDAMTKGTRPHKLRIFTTYVFDHGPLKGVRAGGGVRYDSANITGNDTNGARMYGNSHTAFDLMVSCSRKFFGVDWRFQINVYDVFHSSAQATPGVVNPAGTSAHPGGAWDSIIVFPPREISFTVNTTF